MELSEGEQDYTKLRGKLFAKKILDELSRGDPRQWPVPDCQDGDS
jgi:hypothetical protein